MDITEEDYNKVKDENNTLKDENNTLKECLKKYTNPKRNKKYYETHKEELKERNYKKSTSTPEQRKLWNKQYYEKKKLEIKNNN